MESDAAVILVNVPMQIGMRGDLRTPLGLLSLATVLRDSGIPTRVLDLQHPKASWGALTHAVTTTPKSIVGFGCDSDNIRQVLRLSDRLLELSQQLIVVLGGPHVTGSRQSYVTTRRFVIRGEGEFPLLALARWYLLGEGTIQDVPSLSYVMAGGQEAHNRVSLGPYWDVNAIPTPDYSLLEHNEDYAVSTATSRGCMYRCNFCSEGRKEQPYRARSLLRVEEDLLHLKMLRKDRSSYIVFVDDTFTASRERVMGVCDTIDRIFPNKEKFGFFCEGRANVLAQHTALVPRLVSAGIRRLQIGIESGQEHLLAAINKGCRADQVEAVMNASNAAGVPSVFGAFILGLPHQTADDVYADIAFAKRLISLAPGVLDLTASALTPLPGTEFGEHPDKWGLRIFDPCFETGMVTEDCFAETEHLSRSRIEELRLLFRNEIDRYTLDAVSSLSPERLRKCISRAIDWGMHTLPVRLVCRYSHVLTIVGWRTRGNFRFADEIGFDNLEQAMPMRSGNSLVRCGPQYIVNEGSVRSFLLSTEEAKCYERFAGKLTVRELGSLLAKERGVSDSEGVKECLRIYRKCEDNLAAILAFPFQSGLRAAY